VGGRIDATAMVRVDRYQRMGGDRPAPPQPACSRARRGAAAAPLGEALRLRQRQHGGLPTVPSFGSFIALPARSNPACIGSSTSRRSPFGGRGRAQCPDRCSHHDLRGPAGDADLRVAACAPTARRDLDPGRCASTRRVRCLAIGHGVGAPSRIDQRTTLRRSGRSGSIGGTWSAASSRASGEG